MITILFFALALFIGVTVPERYGLPAPESLAAAAAIGYAARSVRGLLFWRS